MKGLCSACCGWETTAPVRPASANVLQERRQFPSRLWGARQRNVAARISQPRGIVLVMLKLEQITKGATIAGLEPDGPVQVVTAEHHGPVTLTISYGRSNGELPERLIYCNEEAQLALVASRTDSVVMTRAPAARGT